MKKKLTLIMLTLTMLFMSCGKTEAADGAETGSEATAARQDFGVFLSVEYDQLPKNTSYDVLIIDAQYYTAEQIAALKKTNGQVYSYLDVGSLEDFRDHYDDFKEYALAPYENWSEEYWMDVTNTKWQQFILRTLAPNLVNKGVDGFFIDNVDVYYHYTNDDVFNSISVILTGLKSTGKKVIINGGDTYVSKYLEDNGTLDPVLDGVNQESVYTSINWEEHTFGRSDEEDMEYYLTYLKDVKDDGKEVFLLEYTDDDELAAEIKDNCKKLGYHLFVSDDLQLGNNEDSEEASDDEASDSMEQENDMSQDFYAEEITEDSEIFARMKGKSYKDNCTVPLSDLRYLHVLHVGFDGETHQGEIVCNKAIADDLLEIFEGLYEAKYPIEKIKLVDEYNADDESSMADNNSSAFNFRFISHTTKVSNHGYGMAIDINPLYNPYVKTVNGQLSIEPANSAPYVDRAADFPYKIDENDLAYQLFTAHGFTWGGAWKNSKDYQHFEKE